MFFDHFFMILYIDHYAINEQRCFYFFFLKLYTLFYLSCLTALVKTFNMMLNRSGKREHHYHVHRLMGKIFSFSFLNIMLTAGFLYMFFIKLRKFFSIPCLVSLFNWLSIVFCQILFLHQSICLYDLLPLPCILIGRLY